MWFTRVITFILLMLCTDVHSKVFTRCQLTRELLKNGFSRTFLSNWVCLVEQESDRNTSALLVKTSRRKYYGLFQIGSEWCKEGKKGGKCEISCQSLLDDDIKDDGNCALKVFEQEGFKYWPKWEARCKGQLLPDIEKKVRSVLLFREISETYGTKLLWRYPLWCPDWQHPPSRVSPPRDKRTIMVRPKRSARNRLERSYNKSRVVKAKRRIGKRRHEKHLIAAGSLSGVA